ncbi:hypothetical protein QTN47_04880 [Danxiaibacter flavus]|uniref:DUF998 domain-containing protein n=1 Tax=Danxiaibacter flavus TaxID=3049108 RepID=A0ABV3ZAC4_9BACT|nr:hypothetical protein QNM32_04880 [Chitinophagaceae bacterium DXS]
MIKSTLLRNTGVTGIVLYLLVLAEIHLYFVYTPTPEGTPPPNTVLIRILLDLFICAGLIGFFSQFKYIVAQLHPDHIRIGDFLFSCGLAFAIVSLIADAIQSGSIWIANNKPVNPTWVGYGAEGALLIYGPINRLLNTIILFTGSTLIIKTNLFPKWTAVLGYIFAVYNLAFVPTIFFMTTPLDFYSVNGWNIPIAAGLFFLWILIISVFLIGKKTAGPHALI